MAEDINYLDIVILKKIDSDSTVEKFGGHINTSFFETANILGSMKIKGLIDIHSSVAGHSPLKMTTYGHELLEELSSRSGQPLDNLDKSILHALAAGVRDLEVLSKTINVRNKDLAMHLYKLKAYDYVDHDVRSGVVNFTLTEKGFSLTGGLRAKQYKTEEQKEEKEESIEDDESESVQEQKKEGETLAIDDLLKDMFGMKKESGGKREITKTENNTLDKKTDDKNKIIHKKNHEKADIIHKKRVTRPHVYNGKPRLDKTEMLMSKIEFYISRYGFFMILALLFGAILVYALLFIILS